MKLKHRKCNFIKMNQFPDAQFLCEQNFRFKSIQRSVTKIDIINIIIIESVIFIMPVGYIFGQFFYL